MAALGSEDFVCRIGVTRSTQAEYWRTWRYIPNTYLLTLRPRKTENSRKGWGTARRHHTGILRRGVWCARQPIRFAWCFSFFEETNESCDATCTQPILVDTRATPLRPLPIRRFGVRPSLLPAPPSPPDSPLASSAGRRPWCVPVARIARAPMDLAGAGPEAVRATRARAPQRSRRSCKTRSSSAERSRSLSSRRR